MILKRFRIMTLCGRNPRCIDVFVSRKAHNAGFDGVFVVNLNKLLIKQSSCLSFETPFRWDHCNFRPATDKCNHETRSRQCNWFGMPVRLPVKAIYPLDDFYMIHSISLASIWYYLFITLSCNSTNIQIYQVATCKLSICYDFDSIGLLMFV